MPSPVPNNLSFVEYYESIWGTELLNDVIVYGYFQLNSVLEAIKCDKKLKTVLKVLNIEFSSDMVMTKYNWTICAKNAYHVLSNAVDNINQLDIDPIQVRIELVDNPMIQCAQSD